MEHWPNVHQINTLFTPIHRLKYYNWTVPYWVLSVLKSRSYSHQIIFLVNSIFSKILHISLLRLPPPFSDSWFTLDAVLVVTLFCCLTKEWKSGKQSIHPANYCTCDTSWEMWSMWKSAKINVQSKTVSRMHNVAHGSSPHISQMALPAHWTICQYMNW